jgi:hypothetical protein
MKLNIVPARTGIQWVKLGLLTFSRQPLAMAGLFFMYMMAATLLSLIPYAGLVLALAIVPGATLGLMAATQEAEKGRFPMPTVLLSGFRADRQRLRAMLVLGFLYAAACMMVMAVVSALVDVEPSQGPATAEGMMAPRFQMAMLLGSVLYLPISLMFWHAPALVHWHGISPLKSLFFSLVACLRNVKALLVFGLAWTAVIFAVSLLIGVVAMATGNPQVAATALMPLGLLVTAMFSTSLYFTFRDSFVAPAETGSPSPGELP